MIIYGYRETALGMKVLPEERPEGAGESGVTLALFARYPHIFWIPLVPAGKVVRAISNETEEKIKKKDWTKRMRDEASLLKETHRTPVWHFLGIALILVIVGVVFFKGRAKEKTLTQYLSEPKIGDLYFVKDEADDPVYPYYMERVVDTAGEILIVQWSTGAYNMVDGLEDDFDNKAYRNKGYFHDTAFFYRFASDLDSLHKAKILVDVKRDTTQLLAHLRPALDSLFMDEDEGEYENVIVTPEGEVIIEDLDSSGAD